MPAQEVPLSQCAGAAGMLVLAWAVLAQTAAANSLRMFARGMSESQSVYALERQLSILRWTGLIVAAICLGGFRLAGAVKTWPVFADSMTLQLLVLLIPGVTIVGAIWMVECRYGVSMGYVQDRGILAWRDAAASLISSGGWILVPVLGILLATDLLRAFTSLDETTAASIVGGGSLLAVPVLLPFLMRSVWKTRPLDRVDFAWVIELLQATELPGLSTRVWDTGMKSQNAVVVGFLPRMRFLIVTDKLLRDMPRQLLGMVILHEIAHVRRHHVWIRVMLMIPSWLVAAGVCAAFGPSLGVTMASNVIAIVTTLLTLRWIAHSTEYDADRWACEASTRMPAVLNPPRTNEAAAERFCEALRFVTRHDSRPDRTSWLHPSVESRCERLLANFWDENRVTPTRRGIYSPNVS